MFADTLQMMMDDAGVVDAAHGGSLAEGSK
jgi:hypothetical protein